jgi:inorganic triphosphatase YgiF
MPVPLETELKLDVAPSAFPQLARSAVLKGHARARRRTIVSVYFDTADFRLRKAGFTLRVRRDGRRRLQTIKQEGEHAALLSRNEWEQPIRSDSPDLDAARDTALKPLLTKKLARKLKPVFETSVRRTTYPLRDGGSQIELALDEGKVVAGRKSSPLHDVEIELKSGAAVDLFKLARALGRDVPVQLSVRTKAERGYALAERALPTPVKAIPVALAPDFTAGAALQAIARACLHQLVANQPLIRIGKPDGLHQMRVAVRRLRAALSLFAPMLTDAQSQGLKSQLRWLTGELSPARELDVFLDRVMDLLVEGRHDKPGLDALLEDLRRRRAQAYARVRTAYNSFRFRDLILDTAAWIEVGEWTRNADEFIPALRQRLIAETATDELKRRYKKIRKHGKRLRRLSPEQRHKLRIRTKKVRYAAEFFAGAFPGRKAGQRREDFVAALEKLQDALGDLNDISVHEDLSAGLAQQDADGTSRRLRRRKAFAAGRLSGFEEARVSSVLREAERAYRVFARAKPFWS